MAERPPRETTPEWGREDFVFGFSSSSSSSSSSAAAANAAAADDDGGGKSLVDNSKHEPLPKPWRGLGARVEDWGEQLTGRARPGVFVLDVPSAAVLAAPSPPSPTKSPRKDDDDADNGDDEDGEDSSSSSEGQPALSRCGRAVVYVSWPHKDENLYPGLGKQ